MTGTVFDIALEKRFKDSPVAVLGDVTSADTLLIRNNETGVVLRLPFSILTSAVSGALTGYMRGINNLSEVANAGTARANLGLGNIDNTSDADKPVSTAQQTAINARIATAEKGAANGVAPLGADSKVPSSFLPSFVVSNSATPASATATGITGDICWDANYVYVCVASNTWKRAPLNSW